MECSYCKKKFSTKSSLNSHQKTTKYCLKLRDDLKLNFFYKHYIEIGKYETTVSDSDDSFYTPYALGSIGTLSYR